MRTLALAFTALTLAWISGPVEAAFVLIFDDPDTPDVELRIEDQGAGDFNSAVGFIGFNFDEEDFTASGTAASKPAHGSGTTPQLLLDVQFVRSFGNLLISVTDTDFDSDLPGGAATYTVGLGSGDNIRFDFLGDSANGEFTEGFLIGSATAGPGEVDVPFMDVIGPAGPVGSLTMSALLQVDAGDGFATFIIALELGTVGAPCTGDAECDDDQFCNGVETCVAGQCQAGTNPCTGQDEICLEATDTCLSPECVDDDDCNDFVFCNGEESCDPGGECKSDLDGTPCVGNDVCIEEINVCTDPQCTIDAECDDGKYCNGGETCSGGVCRNAGPPCADTEFCIEESDQCDSIACSDDPDCDNDVFCDGSERCVAGFCQLGLEPCRGYETCREDSEICVRAVCSEDFQCDDGIFCNGEEKCDRTDNICGPDDSPCIGDDICNEEFDVCVNPQCEADADCDNGQFCDGAEFCHLGLCEAGMLPCEQGESCDELADTCGEPQPECTDNAECDDGEFCNGTEICDAGECQGSASPCADGQFCLEALDYCYEQECTAAQSVQVFVTSARFKADLGGLTGADDACTSAAAAAGLSGSWTAWLSDSTTDARDRILESEYQLLDGTVVANDLADLTDGALLAPINLDESGTPVSENPFLWTGTQPDGTGTNDTCSDWTDNTNSSIATQGDNTSAISTWTQLGSTAPCDFQRRLYCFADAAIDSTCDDGDPCNGNETCNALGRCRDGTLQDCALGGAVPDGANVLGEQLTVGKTDSSNILSLFWGDSCNAANVDYAVYEGQLRDFANSVPVVSPDCTTGGATSADVTLQDGDRYFLVVPISVSGFEGSYGPASDGTQRPVSQSACASQLIGGCCSVDGDCDDGQLCTGMETCDAGLCQGGTGPCDNEFCLEDTGIDCVQCRSDQDCKDPDFCTDDLCVDGLCENIFDPGNFEFCRSDDPALVVDAPCAYDLGDTEVCVQFFQGADDGDLGGADEIAAIGWCFTWDSPELSFDCTDSDDDGVPDDITFLADSDLTTAVTCTPEDPNCRVRLAVLDTVDPVAPLPDAVLACARLQVNTNAGDLEIPIGLAEVTAGDVEGSSIPVYTKDDSIDFSDCCPADCNGDGVVDVADAIAVALESSDADGSDACNTQGDVPFDGVPCCDCNNDRIVDVADSVCIVNGIGQLSCSSARMSSSAVGMTETTELAKAADTSELSAGSGRSDLLAPRAATRIGVPLMLEQHVSDDSVVVPLIFRQGRDDGRPGGPDELSAFSICIDFDQDQLEFDETDEDGDGVPDALSLRLPSSHSPLVWVDLTRPSCELQLGVIDFSSPSEPLPDGTLAEIQFRRVGRASEGIWVRPGAIGPQSFADVLGTSVRGRVQGADRRVAAPVEGND